MDIELLPRRLIFANPERIIVRISHDGTRIAFLEPVDGVLNLWVGPIARIEDACPVTKATDRNLGPWIVWMHDNRHVLFFRDKAGDENWCTYYRPGIRRHPCSTFADDFAYLTRLNPGELAITGMSQDRALAHRLLPRSRAPGVRNVPWE